MILLIAIATIGAIGIAVGTSTQSAQAFGGRGEGNPSTGDPHTTSGFGEPTGNPHQFPTCSGNPHGQTLNGPNGQQCPGAN
ncbi:MAG: hypothetical protein WBZ36_20135 [Candidatus Nitrosopolaris sp.]